MRQPTPATRRVGLVLGCGRSRLVGRENPSHRAAAVAKRRAAECQVVVLDLHDVRLPARRDVTAQPWEVVVMKRGDLRRQPGQRRRQDVQAAAAGSGGTRAEIRALDLFDEIASLCEAGIDWPRVAVPHVDDRNPMADGHAMQELCYDTSPVHRVGPGTERHREHQAKRGRTLPSRLFLLRRQ